MRQWISLMNIVTRWLFAAGVVLLFFSYQALAQETSSITGTVTDPSGAVIPNAKVTVTHQETSTMYTTLSNDVGLYATPGLPVGHYNLVVAAKGFETYRKTAITVNAGQTVREDVRLSVGASAQTVTVEAAALQVQAETNEVSTLISGQQVLNIATDGRNITSLTTLGTGVSWNGPAFNGVTAQNSTATISFNGLRPDHNNFLVDGGEAYDRGSGGKLDVLPSPDAIGQFQVLSSNYAPDYGIASGGTVLVELKSGTQRFHGTLWEFNRNDDFDATPYFDKISTPYTAVPELRLNLFGGNIGGPVFIPHVYNENRQKTFFFFNEEDRRYIAGVSPSPVETPLAQDFPSSANLSSGYLNYQQFNCGTASGQTPCKAPVVPTTGLTTYNYEGLTPGSPFPYCSGTSGPSTTGAPACYAIPAGMIDPNAQLFMGTGAIPQPNHADANGVLDQYIASPAQPTFVREEVVRIDHNISDKLHLMGSWIHDAMSQTIIPTQWSGDNYDTIGDLFGNPSWSAAVRLTQEISPSVVNETGLYVNGNYIHVSPYSPLGSKGYTQPSGWSASSFFTNNNLDNRMPQIGFGAPLGTTWSVIYWPWKNSFLDYQIRDDLSWTKGKHSWKFGIGLMREDKNQQLQADTEGDYSFGNSAFADDSYVNFLLGFASSYDQLEQQRTDYWISDNYAAYAMDDWHVTPRLTLNLGLRYDALPHTYEKFNDVANFVPDTYNTTDAATFNSSGTLCTAAATATTNAGCTAASPGLTAAQGATFYLNGIQEAGVNGYPRGMVNNDYFTWQPRLGFALDLFGGGKTVLRGGVGFFYERMQGNDIYNTDTTPPFAYQPSVSNVFFSSPATSITTGATASVPIAPASLTRMGSETSDYYPNPATVQYSLGIQHQLAPSVVAVVMYVGSGAWDQDDKRETNDLPLSAVTDREGVANGTLTANLYRPYLGFSNTVVEEDATNANYNSLQASLRMEARHGLTMELAYTWSHEIDIQSADLTTANESGTSFISDPYDLRYDRGSGLFDRRNIFNANFIYAEPFFKSGNAMERSFLSGWQLADVTVAESGSPQNIYYNGPDVLGLGGNATSRMSFVTPGKVSFPHTRTAWFTKADFTNPVAPWAGGTTNGFGDAGKDTIVQPGLFNFNMSLYKDFPLTKAEGPRIEVRFESFNTFNHTEWNGIDTGSTDGQYGQVTSTYDPRVFQFGGKFLF